MARENLLMKRFRLGLAFAAILIAGCDHTNGILRSSRANNGPNAAGQEVLPKRYDLNAPFLFTQLQSRAVTQENPTGGKGLGGKGRGNGNGRKGAPAFRNVEPGETKVLADITGPGMIRHLWMTVEDKTPEMLRSHIVRIYWDDSPYPSVEAPMGDFFGVAHGRTVHFMTPYVGTPEGRGFHCYFPMPFSKRCRITFENDSDARMPWLFYQVDYTLGDAVTDDWGRFHAHFRRENPCPIDRDYTLLDTEGTPGVFIGAVIGVNPKGPVWWGEGEMKFYIDGDSVYPTICGTGTEDYICTGWGMHPHDAIYTGVNHMVRDPATGWSRFVSFYRFHVRDPIFFSNSLRVELQQLGAGLKADEIKAYGYKGPHVHPGMSDWLFDRSDDYCSVAYWYQKVLDRPLPPLPSRAARIEGIAEQAWEKQSGDSR